jgi:hypothetical protein
VIPRRLLIAVSVLILGVFGLGLYVGRVVRRVRQPAPAVADTSPVAPPVKGTPTNVVLFVADDTDGALHRQTFTIPVPEDPAKREGEILRALVALYHKEDSPHPLAAGADIMNVYLVNGSLAVVDVNGIFADGHRSDILAEELTLASLAETLAGNLPGITNMKLLVDGKERPTLAGHADLTQPYRVADAAPLVR